MSVSQGTSSFQFSNHAFSRGGSGSAQSSGFIYDYDVKEAAVSNLLGQRETPRGISRGVMRGVS